MGSEGINTTTESFQMRYCMQVNLKESENCQKDLEIQIYLIKMNFFGNFNFDIWQF